MADAESDNGQPPVRPANANNLINRFQCAKYRFGGYAPLRFCLPSFRFCTARGQITVKLVLRCRATVNHGEGCAERSNVSFLYCRNIVEVYSVVVEALDKSSNYGTNLHCHLCIVEVNQPTLITCPTVTIRWFSVECILLSTIRLGYDSQCFVWTIVWIWTLKPDVC